MWTILIFTADYQRVANYFLHYTHDIADSRYSARETHIQTKCLLISIYLYTSPVSFRGLKGDIIYIDDDIYSDDVLRCEVFSPMAPWGKVRPFSDLVFKTNNFQER